jgi:hypothetical protein
VRSLLGKWLRTGYIPVGYEVKLSGGAGKFLLYIIVCIRERCDG